MSIKSLRTLFFIVLYLCLFNALSYATDYYVDGTNGDDANYGLATDNAWKTITHALAGVEATEEDPAVINIAAGTYSASTNGETFPLQIASYIHFLGFGAEITSLDAERNVDRLIICESSIDVFIENLTLERVHPDLEQDQADTETNAAALQCSDSSLTIKKCILRKHSCARMVTAPVIVVDSSILNIIDCVFSDNRSGLPNASAASYSSGAIRCYDSKLTVSSSVFKSNNPGAITASNSIISISDSEFIGNKGGTVLANYGTDLHISSCLFQGNLSRCVMQSQGEFYMEGCFFYDNSWTIMDYSSNKGYIVNSVIQDNTLMSTSRERYFLMEFTHSQCVLDSCSISNNMLRGEEAIAIWDYRNPVYPDTNVRLHNCEIINNKTISSYFIALYDCTESPVKSGYFFETEAFLELDGCTIGSNAVEGFYQSTITSFLEIQNRHALLSGCIFYNNEADFFLNQGKTNHDVHFDHCCLQEEFDGEGNFVADPLFVSGPLGDYYLSCVEAGQEADSPCIDAGSTSASIAGVGRLTTRTDGEFDAGVVDIGYHYSATPPTIDCSVLSAGEPLKPGDALSASISVENAGLPQWVDVYAGFILPDGSIFCITPGGLTGEFAPLSASLILPKGLAPTPTVVFGAQIPDGLTSGQYTFAAALSLTGAFRPIGDIAFAAFAVGG